jgi:periplasmic glucans biosynthesis protein
MDRRTLLKLSAGFSAAVLLARQVFPAGRAEASEIASLTRLPLAAGTPFAEETVIEQARLLAKSPYLPPPDTVPQIYKDLDYDRYRAIRFRKNLALWSGDNSAFTAELFSAAYIYRTPVRIFVVEGGQAAEIEYDPEIFTYGPEVSRPPEGTRPGFSGLRFHASIDKPGVMDEFAVFQGASYFRAKAAGQGYGMSGRGLAINTAQPPADEFPIFRSYWLEKPAPGSRTVTVFALLDSVSASGAYKFVISTGYNTIMDVDCTIFPRTAVPYAGIAPLTSMFYFAPSSSYHADEARLRVHDSDGLSILNAKGEYIWRPLINPSRVQYSAFADGGTKGFGLMQRERRADRYQDIDARYEIRPSVWVEPKESWGEGSVELVELPTKTEYFDNIVAFWHPKEPLQPGTAYTYRYRLTWCQEPPVRTDLATVTQTLVGASTRQEGLRVFYADFAGTEKFNLCDDLTDFCGGKTGNVELSASAGNFVNIAIRRNQIAGGHRVSFEYQPAPGSLQADLRCVLVAGGKQVSEVWLYRWTA